MVNVLDIGARLDRALEQAVDQLVTIGAGIVSVVLVIALARLIVKFAKRVFWRRIGRSDLEPNATILINNGISFLVYFAAGTLLLALWGASWSTLLTAISISTLAVVLGFQDLLKSLLGGAFVILDQPYSVGDRIAISNIEGEVTDIGLRTTIIRATEGHKITIPNSMVLVTPLENLDRSVKSATRIWVTGVRGEKDRVAEQITAALEAEPRIEASVSVETETSLKFREALTRIGLPGGANTDQERALRIAIAIPGNDESRKSAADAVRRLKALFPDAEMTVRREARRT